MAKKGKKKCCGKFKTKGTHCKSCPVTKNLKAQKKKKKKDKGKKKKST